MNSDERKALRAKATENPYRLDGDDLLPVLDALDAETARADAAEAALRLATEQGDRYLAASKAASRERWDAIRERDERC
jgi:hypothetical protein